MEFLITLIGHTWFLVMFSGFALFLFNDKDRDDEVENYKLAQFIASIIVLVLELAILGIITLFNQ